MRSEKYQQWDTSTGLKTPDFSEIIGAALDCYPIAYPKPVGDEDRESLLRLAQAADNVRMGILSGVDAIGAFLCGAYGRSAGELPAFEVAASDLFKLGWHLSTLAEILDGLHHLEPDAGFRARYSAEVPDAAPDRGRSKFRTSEVDKGVRDAH